MPTFWGLQQSRNPLTRHDIDATPLICPLTAERSEYHHGMGRLAQHRRLHSVLGYIPPDEFEVTYYAQRAALQPEPPPA